VQDAAIYVAASFGFARELYARYPTMTLIGCRRSVGLLTNCQIDMLDIGEVGFDVFISRAYPNPNPRSCGQ
jgi:hypothetical protein